MRCRPSKRVPVPVRILEQALGAALELEQAQSPAQELELERAQAPVLKLVKAMIRTQLAVRVMASSWERVMA